jgi:ribosome-binding protein aMBF1 (putative translation factor)
MITGAQIQAARRLLGWSIEDLASRSGVGRIALRKFESEQARPDNQIASQIQVALEQAGIDFSDQQKVVLYAKRPTWDSPG